MSPVFLYRYLCSASAQSSASDVFLLLLPCVVPCRVWAAGRFGNCELREYSATMVSTGEDGVDLLRPTIQLRPPLA
jgi:hypothetical protein